MPNLGLREYKSLLVMGTVTKDWEAINIHDNHDNLLADFRPGSPSTSVGGPKDEAKVADKIRKMQKDSAGAEKAFPMELISGRRALRSRAKQLEEMTDLGPLLGPAAGTSEGEQSHDCMIAL